MTRRHLKLHVTVGSWVAVANRTRCQYKKKEQTSGFVATGTAGNVSGGVTHSAADCSAALLDVVTPSPSPPSAAARGG